MHRYFKHLKSSMTFFRYATTSLYIIVHLDTRKSLQLFLFGSVKNATKFEQKKLLRKRFPLKEKGEETTHNTNVENAWSSSKIIRTKTYTFTPHPLHLQYFRQNGLANEFKEEPLNVEPSNWLNLRFEKSFSYDLLLNSTKF